MIVQTAKREVGATSLCGSCLAFVAFGSLLGGCAHDLNAAWDTSKWTMAPKPGLVVIARSGDEPICTGSIVHREAKHYLALTARHCVTGSSAKKANGLFFVALPRRTATGFRWTKYPVHRTVFRPLEPGTADAEGWGTDDWALLEFDSDQSIDPVSIFNGDPRDIKSDETVSLASFLGHDETMFPHEHSFAWGGRT